MDKEKFKELVLKAISNIKEKFDYQVEEAQKIALKTLDLLDDMIFSRIREVPGHELDHTVRVLTTAIYLANAMDAKIKTIVPCALLHDIARLIDPKVKDHSLKSAEIARKLLRKDKDNFSDEDINSIVRCIREHSFSANLGATSLESMIIQDADKLDALGLIGVARVFAFGGFMGRPIADVIDFKSNRTSLGHFYEKILKLEGLINTDVAKKIAVEKTRKVKKFIKELEEELKSFGLCDIK